VLWIRLSVSGGWVYCSLHHLISLSGEHHYGLDSLTCSSLAPRAAALQKGHSSWLQVLQQAPELVIEILSPTNTRREIADKLEDYRSIGVRECWIVSPEALTVEVVRLSAEGIQTIDIFGTGMTIHSEILAGLSLPVAEVFA